MIFLQTSKTGIFSRIIIGLFILAGTLGCQKKGPNKITGAELLPAPQQVEFKKGISINPGKFKTVYLYAAIDEDARFAANLLRDEINQLFDYEVNIEVVKSYKDLSSPSVILGIASEDIGFSNFSSGLPSPQEGNAESYVLDIKAFGGS